MLWSMQKAALARVAPMLVVFSLASACNQSPPKFDGAGVGSARDDAEVHGCTNIKNTTVPADWSDFNQAVTCESKGTSVTVVWKKSGQTGVICNEHAAERCDPAMAAFRPGP